MVEGVQTGKLMDWDKAEQNVKDLILLYQSIGYAGIFGLTFLNNLLQRFWNGERSEDLYESMMEAE